MLSNCRVYQNKVFGTLYRLSRMEWNIRTDHKTQQWSVVDLVDRVSKWTPNRTEQKCLHLKMSNLNVNRRHRKFFSFPFPSELYFIICSSADFGGNSSLSWLYLVFPKRLQHAHTYAFNKTNNKPVKPKYTDFSSSNSRTNDWLIRAGKSQFADRWNRQRHGSFNRGDKTKDTHNCPGEQKKKAKTETQEPKLFGSVDELIDYLERDSVLSGDL